MNRKIELLKKTANSASLGVADGKLAKELFQAVAENALAAVGAEAVLVRFVSPEPLRTEAEFFHAGTNSGAIKVANKDLVALKQNKSSHAFVRSEDEKEILVIPSDHHETGRAYLLMALSGDKVQELDISLLKVFANQAEMLYRSLTPSNV